MALEPLTYCNPLPFENFDKSQRGCAGPQALADPTVIQHEGKWYLYASAAQAWVSDNLIDWKYHKVDTPVEMIGPAIEEYKGWFYLAGNANSGLCRSRHPLGPWENLGPIHDADGKAAHWADVFFFRDGNHFYCYHHSGSGVGVDGIFVTELDPKSNFTKALGPTRNCFAHNPKHLWERWGSSNEFPDIAWIEAPWVTKYKGKYHLQYSGCGTEWRKYAIGVYTSDKPTGPWKYDARSPLIKDMGGLLNGIGHHAMAKGPNGNWWNIYHVLFHNTHRFDRRLAMDPVGFDAKGGMMMTGPSETPQFAPGVNKKPWESNDTGWFPLTIDKPVKASSSGPGRTPGYAVDNIVRTWWEPADDALPQWIRVDLQGIFNIEACRTIFSTMGMNKAEPAPFKYRIEISTDDKNYKVICDKSDNAVERNIEYDPLPTSKGRYVRITVVGAPAGMRLGIIDFTAFGTRAL